jgi:hypothetical protein
MRGSAKKIPAAEVYRKTNRALDSIRLDFSVAPPCCRFISAFDFPGGPSFPLLEGWGICFCIATHNQSSTTLPHHL